MGHSRLHCLCAHSGPICMTKRENNSYFFLFFFVFFSSSYCLHRCYSWNFHCICVSLDNWFVGEQEQVKDPVNLDSIRSRANCRDYDFQPVGGYNITCLHNRLPKGRWQWTRLHSLCRLYIYLTRRYKRTNIIDIFMFYYRIRNSKWFSTFSTIHYLTF